MFEMLSVGLIPIFALSITDNNELITKILNIIGVHNFFEKSNRQETVIFFSTTLLSAFLIKNFIIGWINYLSGKKKLREISECKVVDLGNNNEIKK